MKRSTVLAELAEIADMYPTLRGLMNKRTKAGEYIGNLWADMLSDLDPTHFSNVCYEYAKAERQLPQPADQLPFEIKAEVKRRRDVDIERERSMEIQLAGRAAKDGTAWALVRAEDAKGNLDHVIYTGIPGVHTLRELEAYRAKQQA